MQSGERIVLMTSQIRQNIEFVDDITIDCTKYITNIIMSNICIADCSVILYRVKLSSRFLIP